MKPSMITLAQAAVALSACIAFVPGEATARDRNYSGGAVVRDHRLPVVVRDHREQPIVRDHRTQPVVRDHRNTPIVRDHRGPTALQGGVTVTSSRSRRGGSSCIRSMFGGPCVGL